MSIRREAIPDISILVRTFNTAHTVSRALESVFSEDASISKEVLVIDDGSSDDIDSALKPYLERIRFYSEKNTGGFPLLNKGLALASGEYFLVLDSDDALYPGALRCLLDALREAPQASFAYGDYFEEDVITGKSSFVEVRGDPMKSIMGGVIFRKEAVIAAGGFDISYGFPEYDLFLKFERNLKQGGVYVPKPVYIYSRRPGSMTTTSKERVLKWKKQLTDAWGPLDIREY